MNMTCNACPTYTPCSLNKVGNLYVASFVFTRSGDYRIFPSIAQIGGLSATVYSDCDTSAVADLASSWAHPKECTPVLYSPLAFPAPTAGMEASFIAVRYSGFLRSVSIGQHLIGVRGTGFVSMWVKERIIALSQRLSESVAIEAPFQSDIANAFFDILVAHWQDESAPLGINFTLTDPSGIVRPLNSLSLFSREDVEAAKRFATGTQAYTVTGASNGALQLLHDHQLFSEDPIVFSGAVPVGLTAGALYYVRDTAPLTSSTVSVSSYTDQGSVSPPNSVNASFTLTRIDTKFLRVRPAQCCAAMGKVSDGALPAIQFCGIIYQFQLALNDAYGNPCFQREVTGQPYIATLNKGGFTENIPVRYNGSVAIMTYGPLTDSGSYTLTLQHTGPLSTLTGFPVKFQVFGGSFCSTKSTIEGSGLSSVSLYGSSAISIVNRDMFGNLAIGEFEGISAGECIPDVSVVSSSLSGGVAVQVSVSSAPCTCCKFVTPFHGRGPLLGGSGFEVIPLYNNERLTSLNIVNSGLGVGGAGYTLFPPVTILGKPAVFVKVLHTSNLPIFETSGRPLQQNDDAADLTEFVSTTPYFDTVQGRYVLLYTVRKLPSEGKSTVVSTYAGYHGALLATYYSIKMLQGAGVALFDLDLDGQLATPCLVAPATSSFRGIQAPGGAWVRRLALPSVRFCNTLARYGRTRSGVDKA
jgi:hypothetical protein